MSISEVKGVRLVGIAGCVPLNEVDNLTAASANLGDSVGDIIRATGIEKRRVCAKASTSSLDLCHAAAQRLITDQDVDRASIGAVICVTFTPATPLPGNAFNLQHLLGLPSHIPAFDLSMACSGYVFGLWIAAMTAVNLGKPVLLIDGDRQSHITAPDDKGTALIFADAGSASIIAPGGDETWYFKFFTDGSMASAIQIPAGGSALPLEQDHLVPMFSDKETSRRAIDLQMDGMEVFKFVVKEVPNQVQTLLQALGLEAGSLDSIFLHQANKYMLNQVSRKLKIAADRVPMTLQRFGNSSSATIPVTISDTLAKTPDQVHRKVVLCGFGAGLSVGTALISLEGCLSSGVIEYAE